MNQNEQKSLAQKIRSRYTEKETTELDALRELDKRVKRPANVFAYVFGGISAVIMGCGMSLIMTDIAEIVGISGDPMLLGIVIGVTGLALALLNLPIHKGILNARKKKYAPEILQVSESILRKD